MALDGSQHWGESADAYRRAIILDPENSALLNNAGVSMLNQGRSREAIDFFRQALALDPGDRRAANNLDIARIRSGERPSFGRDGGITARAERLNNAGYAALQAGDEDSASRYFREAISLYPFRFEAAETNLKGADVAKGIQ